MAQFLDLEIAPIHVRMAASALEERSLTLAPRGFGKSTLLSIVRCLFEIVRNPNVRILIASNTQAQAETFVREIRGHFERNTQFRKLYGDYVGPKWTDTELIVSRRRRIAKESTIFAMGVGGALASRHFDLVICDDIVDEENSRSKSRRDKLTTWFYKVLLPCLEPDACLSIVGTRYHYNDLYGHFIESGFVKAVTIIRAIDSKGESPWSEKFPAQRLEQIRREAGTIIFNTQYQNDTEAMKGAVFKNKWLSYYDTAPDRLKIFQGVDLAIGQNDGSDYFAVVTIGVDPHGVIYVLECHQARLSFRQQTEAIVSRFHRFSPIKVAIESNAYQAAQVERVKELGVARAVKAFTSRDKLTRAWKLSALFEDGRIRIRRDMTELTEQLLAFPQCEHDDLFDALELAVSVSASSGPRMRFI